MAQRKRRISKRYLKPRWSYLSQDKKGILYVSGISVKDLERKYGTPLYVMVESEIRKRFRRFKAAFPYPKLRVQYASKINSNLEILKIAREEGIEIDASSLGEIILALLADFEPNQVTFTNLYKTEQDILFAARVGVQAITADSIEELARIAAVGEKLRKKIKIFIRVNPMIDLGKYTSKKQQYGVPIGYAKKAIDIAIKSRWLDLIGLHCHCGYIENPKVYHIAANRLLKLARYCLDNKTKIRYIDLGGGFPVEYNSKKCFQPEDMGKKFVEFFMKKIIEYDLPPPHLIFEPGKFICAHAGLGLVKVISKKNLGKRKVVITDGSTYAFVPDPIIYHAYYEMLPANKMNKRVSRKYTVAGCTCDSIDIIGSNREFPQLEENDLLAIMDCGAYSNVMASNFNTLKRAPMVMIREDGSIKLIRRRDRYSEMFAPELDVLKMADPNELKKFYDISRTNLDKLWGKTKKK